MNETKKLASEHYFDIVGRINNFRYGGAKADKKVFVRKCPLDGCRGFLSTQWKCGACELFTCKECYEQKEADHECKPENVETAKMLAKECKPCPKCGVLTYKIAGCNQIWCVDCHTAWDWASGRVENGNIHNPHYYEWQRQGGTAPRAHGDEVCGGLPNIQTRDIDVNDCHRFVRHARNVILNSFHVVVNPETNQDLQIRYLKKEITKDEWKRQLVLREKKVLLKQEVYDIVEMFINVAEEEFRKYVATNSERSLMKEMESLRTYVNKQLSIVSKRYNSELFRIDSNRYNHSVWNEQTSRDRKHR